MLVLTRKLDEDIRIGDQIVVRVLAVKDGQVKIGIDAPQSMRVFRGELYAAVQRQNEVAASVHRSAAAEAAAKLLSINLGGRRSQNP